MLGIQSLVTYEGRTVEEIKAAFAEAVDDYLELCAQEGIKPEGRGWPARKAEQRLT